MTKYSIRLIYENDICGCLTYLNEDDIKSFELAYYKYPIHMDYMKYHKIKKDGKFIDDESNADEIKYHIECPTKALLNELIGYPKITPDDVVVYKGK